MRISDWSSDVCSSDLLVLRAEQEKAFVAGSDIKEMAFFDHAGAVAYIDRLRQLCDGVRLLSAPASARIDRKSVVEGRSVSVRVDLGGRRIIKKKKAYMIVITTE